MKTAGVEVDGNRQPCDRPRAKRVREVWRRVGFLRCTAPCFCCCNVGGVTCKARLSDHKGRPTHATPGPCKPIRSRPSVNVASIHRWHSYLILTTDLEKP